MRQSLEYLSCGTARFTPLVNLVPCAWAQSIGRAWHASSFANDAVDASKIGFDDSQIYDEIARPHLATHDPYDSNDARAGSRRDSAPGRKNPTRPFTDSRGRDAALIERYFKLTENQTSIKQEMLGGLTTFVTMAYVIVVNPQIWRTRECPWRAWSLRPAFPRRWPRW